MHVVSRKCSSSVCLEMVTFYSEYQLQHHNQKHIHLVYMTLEWFYMNVAAALQWNGGTVPWSQFGLRQFSLNACGITAARLLPLPPKEFGLFIGDFLALREAKNYSPIWLSLSVSAHFASRSQLRLQGPCLSCRATLFQMEKQRL